MLGYHKRPTCICLYDDVNGGIYVQCMYVSIIVVQVAMAKNKLPLPSVSPSSCPQELVTLLDRSFSFNPRERPSSGEVMKLIAHMMRTHLPEL